MENEFIIAANRSFENSDKLDRLKENEGYQKAMKLQSLGFSNAEQGKKYNELEFEIKAQEVEINLVKYYRKAYHPFKFILRKDFDDICKKYRFTCINIGDYKGYVSDETITKMQNLPKIKKDDLECFMVKEGRGENHGKFVSPNFDVNIIDPQKLKRIQEAYDYIFLSTLFENEYDYITKRSSGGLNEDEYFNHTEFSKLHFLNLADIGLQICGRKCPELYGEIYLNEDIPKPIIIQEVKSGYIIISIMEKEIAHSVLEYRRNDLKQFHLVQGDGFNFPGYEDKYIFNELYKAIENEDEILEKKMKEYIEINSLILDVSKLEQFEIDEL